MAKESFWFKHDYNARSDKELVKVRMRMGLAGIGLYWCIVEMLYEEGGYLLRTEYERISFELQTKNECITELIESYALFQYDDKRFWSTSVLSRLATRKEKSEKARDSINARWSNTNVSVSNYDNDTKRGEKKRREKSRGVRFSEDRLSVIFEDGSSQKLGLGQLQRIKEGEYQPHYIEQGKIE